eukprot:5793366-Pyramimonas_sp.AAC.1
MALRLLVQNSQPGYPPWSCITLELYKVDPMARRQYCGRAQLRGPQLGCFEGSKPYPTVADPSAIWWGT